MTTEYPDDLVFAQMCDRFHKLPSELLNEDYANLMRVWSLLIENERIHNAIAEQRRKRK